MAGWLPISLQNIFMGSIIIWDKFLCVQLQYGQKSLTGQSLNWLVTCRLPLLINVLCCMYLAPSSTLLCESQICCRTILLCALYRHLQVCTVLNWQCIVVRWPISALTRYHYWSWLSVAVPHDPEVVECTLLPPSSLCIEGSSKFSQAENLGALSLWKLKTFLLDVGASELGAKSHLCLRIIPLWTTHCIVACVHTTQKR